MNQSDNSHGLCSVETHNKVNKIRSTADALETVVAENNTFFKAPCPLGKPFACSIHMLNLIKYVPNT
jgi:hypothetical protein